MRHIPGWEPWEDYVNERLSLDPTLASGSQWHDKGDGVDRSQSEWAFVVDAKYTENLSFSVKARQMAKWVGQSVIRGKFFALAIRCWPRGERQPYDFAVIPFELFVAMVERLKDLEDAKKPV